MERLQTVKNYLDVTWEDAQTDAKIAGIIKRAENTLCNYAGAQISFFEGSEEEQLLFDLCRYIYNHAFEEFKVNFRDDLIMLRAKYKVETMEESDEADEDSDV